MAFVDNDALVAVLTRILETFATKEELEAIEAGGVTVDAALSSTSTNPVQNKAVKAALDGKASSSHEHAAGDITSGTLSVARGGTGKNTLTSGSFLVGNETSAVQLKTPAQVLDAIGAVKKDAATSWTNITNSGTAVCWYWKKNGVVFIRGYSSASKNLTANTYTTVGLVPYGYRPTNAMYFTANTIAGSGKIEGVVESDGYVKLYPSYTTSYWGFTVSYPIA